jgi:hypothetical protein
MSIIARAAIKTIMQAIENFTVNETARIIPLRVLTDQCEANHKTQSAMANPPIAKTAKPSRVVQ